MYDELSIVVIEIKAVLNLKPVAYVSMDDLEESLTLLSPAWLQNFINDPDPITSANDLSHRMKHLLKTSEKFCKCWKEYVLELHCTFQTSKGVRDATQEGQIVTVYDEGQPRGLWRVGTGGLRKSHQVQMEGSRVFKYMCSPRLGELQC